MHTRFSYKSNSIQQKIYNSKNDCTCKRHVDVYNMKQNLSDKCLCVCFISETLLCLAVCMVYVAQGHYIRSSGCVYGGYRYPVGTYFGRFSSNAHFSFSLFKPCCYFKAADIQYEFTPYLRNGSAWELIIYLFKPFHINVLDCLYFVNSLFDF